MYTKTLSALFVFTLVLGLAFVGVHGAFAQTVSPTDMNGTSNTLNSSPNASSNLNSSSNMNSTGSYVSPTGSPAGVNSTSNTINGTNGTNGTRTTNGTTPGAPNTGAGGDFATNLALLLASGAIAIGGMTYLVRSFYVQ